MGTMTPAQRRALYESARFARETTYNGINKISDSGSLLAELIQTVFERLN